MMRYTVHILSASIVAASPIGGALAPRLDSPYWQLPEGFGARRAVTVRAPSEEDALDLVEAMALDGFGDAPFTDEVAA